jgi:hypothetical protein
MSRKQHELREKIRRELTKLVIKLLNDLNVRMNQEYSFIIEDLTSYIFELVTLEEDSNDNSSQ